MKRTSSPEPRDQKGWRKNGKSSMDLKPWDQKVLTQEQIKKLNIYDLEKALQIAAEAVHLAKKCKIENEGIWPCETELRLQDGVVHHYPNGYYI